ncbi:hypothetical protein AB4572_15765 [Vibrio splendidus]
MAISYLEIIDTAVKIGLGALISGVATWKVTKLQHKNDNEKLRRTHKLESLESVAEQVEIFSHYAMIYWSKITDFTRKQENQAEITSEFRDELNEARNVLYHSYKNLNRAESKLLLLGLTESQQSLRVFGEVVSKFYGEVYIGSHGKPSGEVKLWREDIMANRNIFFEDLNSAYEKL